MKAAILSCALMTLCFAALIAVNLRDCAQGMGFFREGESETALMASGALALSFAVATGVLVA